MPQCPTGHCRHKNLFRIYRPNIDSSNLLRRVNFDASASLGTLIHKNLFRIYRPNIDSSNLLRANLVGCLGRIGRKMFVECLSWDLALELLECLLELNRQKYLLV